MAERVAIAQETTYRPLLEWARNSPLHTGALGHSVHPPLTDVTLGCWLSASIPDGLGGSDSGRGASVLVAGGLLASVPTALAGAADWTELSGDERRVARVRGRHALGAELGLARNAVMMAAGLLGGHLALNRATARRDPLGVPGTGPRHV